MSDIDETIWSELIRAYFALDAVGEVEPRGFGELADRLSAPVADLARAVETLAGDAGSQAPCSLFAFRAAARLQAVRGALRALAELAADSDRADTDARALAKLALAARDQARAGVEEVCALGRALLVERAAWTARTPLPAAWLQADGFRGVFVHTRIDDAVTAVERPADGFATGDRALTC